VTSELRRRDHANAGDSLPSADVPDEILPLVLAMNDLISRLDAQLEFRQRFISDAAHELRTPLTALRLQVGNLRGAASGPTAKALIDEMERGLRRMSEMIAQMLDLARAEAPSASRALSPIDLRDAIAGALEDVISLASEKGIDIGLDSSIAASVMGNVDEIRILLKNLLDNAVRYTPPSGRIDLDLSRAGSRIVLEIRDTGPGVPDPLLGRLFDRFFRGAGAATEGSGLGLAIVKAIADRCGAAVVLANRHDRSGLVARVTFLEARGEEPKSPPVGLPRAGRLRVGPGAGSPPRDTTESTEPELAQN
jgi:two-component system OmpR family sensor kinase